jgi:hypothetical protein
MFCLVDHHQFWSTNYGENLAQNSVLTIR